jgi:hypothetical protein
VAVTAVMVAVMVTVMMMISVMWLGLVMVRHLRLVMVTMHFP